MALMEQYASDANNRLNLYIGGGVNLVIGLVLLALMVLLGVPALVVGGGICFLLGAVLLYGAANGRRAAAAGQRIEQAGIVAQATIENASYSGVQMNGIPYLNVQFRVEPTGGSPYEVSQHVMAYPLRLPRLQPGNSCPARVDPSDPQRVVIDYGDDVGFGFMRPQSTVSRPTSAAATAGAPEVFDAQTRTSGDPSTIARDAAITAGGAEGTATVMRFADAGEQANSMHAIDVELLIAVPGREPYTLQKHMIVPSQALPGLQMGRSMPARVDLTNPEHPMLEVPT